MAALAIVAAIGGVVAKTGGELAAGNAARKMADYNAKVLKEQGKAAEQQAAWESDRLTRQGSRAVAEIAAGQSSGGLGFSREVLRDQVLESARGVEFTQWEGQFSKSISEARARGQKYEGQQAWYGSLFSATGTFLTGTSSASRAYSSGSTTTATQPTTTGKR